MSAATVAWLARTQDAAGFWSDFHFTATGSSDGWVTAFVACLLHEAKPRLIPAAAALAGNCATRAANWLLTVQQESGGWGYNSGLGADADSSAWAILLLARCGRPIPPAALRFLADHQSGSGLFRTWRLGPDHAWSRPCLDVSLAAAHALVAAGAWSRRAGRAYWRTVLAPCQGDDGTFSGYWWARADYPTWLARRLWRELGRPPRHHPWPVATTDTPFALACAERSPGRLARLRLEDGSWEGSADLLAPPSRPAARPAASHDGRRVFTTAIALAAVAGRARLRPLPANRERSAFGRQCDHTVQAVAAICGLDPARQQAAVALFGTLTRNTLAAPNVWPSPQLSALSMGLPLEFSLASNAPACLRYTCEVGDPVLPGHPRMADGLAALANAAAASGCGERWQALEGVWQAALREQLPLPTATRFRLWGGVAWPAGGTVTLKVYLSTLYGNAPASRHRLRDLLAGAGIAWQGELRALCERLDGVGFPQEAGFGLRSDGAWGVKLYYEFEGWRPELLREIGAWLGFGPVVEALTPALPGVVSADFSRKRRSGLSFRIDPASGAVLDLTTTAPFPPQLLPLEQTISHVAAWMGDAGEKVRRLAALLKSADSHARLFSLFTCSVERQGSSHRSIYLRPAPHHLPHRM